MAKVFVFGSNLAGRHGKGAALEALREWGAVYGRGYGRQGNSYAIPTKSSSLRTLPLEEIASWVNHFKQHARLFTEDTFLITRIGCGLAGYRDEQVAPMFKGAPSNCILPEGWKTIISGRGEDANQNVRL